jgi:hypothetical protein
MEPVNNEEEKGKRRMRYGEVKKKSFLMSCLNNTTLRPTKHRIKMSISETIRRKEKKKEIG